MAGLAVTDPRLAVTQADITTLAVDAIVNAANESLLGGGGVDGAIHDAAGPELMQELRRFPGCPTGEAVLTRGYRLPARWVIHAVGPVHDRSQDRSGVLASAYRRSLEVADAIGARSVAFPAISAGAYGWPMDDAARIAVETVRSTRTDVELVRFVLITPTPLRIFSRLLGSD